MEKDNQKLVTRFVLYLLGMLLLALGLTLNPLTGLGASAIVSIPFTISEGTGLNFGNLTLVAYCVLVAAQFVVKGKNRTWVDLLQLVVSLVFTRFLNVFKAMIPYESGFLPADIALLVVAIILTGVGAAMTVDMQLVPNPGDGIVNSLAQRFGKELGFCKNCFDIGCVSASLLIGFAFGDALLGIGLGTILSMVGVGRSIAVFNALCKHPLQSAAGLAPVRA